MEQTIVTVLWMDAQDHPDKWVDADDAESFTDVEVNVTSIGYLVRKTDKYVTLAGDYDAVDNDYGRVTKIPIGMIKEIKELTHTP
jgi:hypothetical protein